MLLFVLCVFRLVIVKSRPIFWVFVHVLLPSFGCDRNVCWMRREMLLTFSWVSGLQIHQQHSAAAAESWLCRETQLLSVIIHVSLLSAIIQASTNEHWLAYTIEWLPASVTILPSDHTCSGHFFLLTAAVQLVSLNKLIALSIGDYNNERVKIICLYTIPAAGSGKSQN